MNAANPQYEYGLLKFGTILTVILLVAGTAIGTYAAAQLAWPFLNFDIAEITFGRLRVVHTNTIILGFGGLALFVTSLYSVQRTNSNRLWCVPCAWLSALFLIVSIVGGIIGIAFGLTQAREYHEMEWIFDLGVAIGWVLWTMVFVMTIATRDKEKVPHVYVSNWFYLALLIAVTYLFLVNGLSIPVTWYKSYSLYSGVQDAMIQWWWGHNAVGFFLTAGFLGMMYYFVPKQARRPVYSYRLSVVHFWALIFGYVWLGAHHLQYTAVPDWTGSLGAVISLAMIIPSWGGALNGMLTLSGAWDRLRTDYILRFLIMALAFYAMSTFEGPVMSSKTVNALSHYTDWTIGHVHSGALGWVAMVAIGSIYHMVMKMWNTEMYSMKLINVHFWLATLGTVLYIVAMWVSGIMQGLMWRAYDEYGVLAYTFAESVAAMHPYYVMRFMGGVLFVAGALVMLYNVAMTVATAKSRQPAVAAA
ncbi:cytochrome c oxidase cbb3-type subunit 1 [Sulfurivirga caldicuralii]|uniref:cytochrome-c oxidase n=1 Tax=Sulfurivirga caldicuralii TaxID=364032 RepID=A0A1N6DEQ4_9GAMM|nr:cytochrome-c oxidase, cbb3-type subunit I [Sulfurivirga caldicuralii]SIN69236.1 cytochrome c oxidase cbb3-type subunit 1 [Sulfurivirga caldicuralii]